MCGRMSLTRSSVIEIADELDAVLAPDDAALYRPRYNLAPTDAHWIVRAGDQAGRRALVPAVWGLRREVKGKPGALVINVQAERVERGAFRTAVSDGRCVVPADGFFEWTGDKRDRRPLWFHAPDGSLLLFAAVFRLRSDGRPEFVVITRHAEGALEKIHDRMPAALPRARLDDWLARPDLALLAIDPVPLVGTPVSKRVNSVANDDPECVREVAPPPQQLPLL
jgi:putative SOS response-associated peptidase YedK